MSAEAVAQLIERELRSSISYVKRLGYSEQERLDLIVLAEPEVCRAVEERDLPIASLTAYTPYQAGLLLGLGEVAPEDSGLSDVLHARWLAAKRHPLLALPTELLRDRLLYDRLFKAGFAAAAALSLFAVADIVSLTFDALDTTTTIDVLEQQMVTERQAADTSKGRLSALDVRLDDVVLVDNAADLVARGSVDIEDLLRRVSSALGADGIVQKAVFRVPSLAGGGASTPPAAGPVRPVGPKAPAKIHGPPVRADEVIYELSLVVKFAANPASPQIPLEQAKAFQERLGKQFAGYTINALRLPVNPLRSQVIEGRAGEAPASTVPIAEFLIEKRG
jgi:hypothetical protein